MLWNFFESGKLFRSTLFDKLSNNGGKNSWLVLNKILFYTHIVIQYFEVYKTYSNTYSTTRLIVGLSSSYLLFCIGRKSNFIQKNWNSQSVPTLEFKSNSTQLKKSHLLPKAKRKLALYISRGRWRQNMLIGFENCQ